jgi:hypothetical protein
MHEKLIPLIPAQAEFLPAPGRAGLCERAFSKHRITASIAGENNRKDGNRNGNSSRTYERLINKWHSRSRSQSAIL